MNERVGLGVGDADRRWIGVRRHQAALAIIGVAVAGDWVTRSRASIDELVIGLALLALVAPMRGGLTGAEGLINVTRFHLRSRWSSIASTTRGPLATTHRDAKVPRGFELIHRGRLDLSGRDVDLAQSLQVLVDRMASSATSQHVSIHTMVRPSGGSTILMVPDQRQAPEGWRPLLERPDALGVASAGRDGEVLLERWRYVRCARGVMTVLRIREFSEVASERALLERIQFCEGSLDLAVHFDVLSTARAQRTSSRAVHGVSTDNAISLTAGFRRTATNVRRFERIRQREQLVASGRSLLQLGVFVTLHAHDLKELDHRRVQLHRALRECGLRSEHGSGRQASWWRAQRPGGGGW